LNAIDQDELLDMRSWTSPPDLVGMVLANVHCILGLDEDWGAIRQSLSSLDTFINQLRYFRPMSLTSWQLQRLRLRLHSCYAAFYPEAVLAINQACALLCCWVNVICWRMGEERWLGDAAASLYPPGGQRRQQPHGNGAIVHDVSSQLNTARSVTQTSLVSAPREQNLKRRDGKSRQTTPRGTTPRRQAPHSSGKADDRKPTPKRQGRQPTPAKQERAPLNKAQKQEVVASCRAKLQAVTRDGRIPWAKIFRDADRNNSGTVGFEAFRAKVRGAAKVAPDVVSDEELRLLFKSMDTKSDGYVSYKADILPWLSRSENSPHARR